MKEPNSNEMFEIIESTGKPIKAWVHGVLIEESAKQQLRNLAGMPFIYSHVAAMPDVHWGCGATVGSVIATKGAIIPAAIGVDIGCGMAAQRTTLTAADLPDNLYALRSSIEARIPHGRTNNGAPGDRGAWGEALPTVPSGIFTALEVIVEKHLKLADAARRAPYHVGTLGTGNHFVEVCVDEEQKVWVMLHSGSRGIGNRIGTYFIEKAKKDMERWFINLPDKDLAYIPQGSDLFKDYIGAVEWAQNFARINRGVMMVAALAALSEAVPKPFICDQEAVNCFAGDTDVSATGVKTAFKRYYSGDMVTLTTKSGRKLTVTPNHPILTRAGWIKAGEIDVGDSLIGACGSDALDSGVYPDVQDKPTEFANLFDSLSVSNATRRIVGSSVNFHGDVDLLADDREVDVVGADLMLRYGKHASLLEKFRELCLLGADLAESEGFGDRLLGELDGRSDDAAPRNIGAANDGATFFDSHGLHSDTQRFTPITSLDADRSEKLGDARGTDFGQFGERFDRSAIGVSLDDVVDVVRGHWAGHVYNLSTDSGWYFSNGIIAHNCHHNYVSWEHHFGENVMLTRKGAVDAHEGVFGIIPGSMGAKSFIVRGKGNRESFSSCSHGAGRSMSRGEARKRFTIEDHATATAGVECRKDADVIDETPGAYKDIDAVMRAQIDLIDIVHTLKQVVCVKG